jgi:hypothetical protein
MYLECKGHTMDFRDKLIMTVTIVVGLLSLDKILSGLIHIGVL